jgi:Domain of unknown function (DUF4465)/PEP-CTERM motif
VLMCVPALARADSWTVDLEDLTLAKDSFYNGRPGNPVPDVVYDGSFTSRGSLFNNEFFSSYYGGSQLFESWSGWSYSNLGDTTTPGFGNQYSSYTGGGLEGVGHNFAVAMTDSLVSPLPARPESFINLPTVPFAPTEMEVYLTNTTYVGLSMKNGDGPGGFGKKFGGSSGDDPDFFKLTILGYSGLNENGSILGSIDFYLADYRFADNSLDYIVNGWTRVDLTGLIGAKSLGFRVDSTDRVQFGGPGSDVFINTPASFALDGLTLFRPTTVPEPSSWAMAMLGIGFIVAAGIARRPLLGD